MYLLPLLSQVTDKPIHYWVNVIPDDVSKGRARLYE
jgi:hypothetical protein